MDPAKKFFTYFLLACTLLYFSHAVYFHRYVYYYSLIESFYTFCSLAVYPLYYLYICKLTSIEQFSLKSYWVLLPAVIIGVLSLIFYGMMNETERINFVAHHFFQITDKLNLFSFAERAQELRIVSPRDCLSYSCFLLPIMGIKTVPIQPGGFPLLCRYRKQDHGSGTKITVNLYAVRNLFGHCQPTGQGILYPGIMVAGHSFTHFWQYAFGQFIAYTQHFTAMISARKLIMCARK